MKANTTKRPARRPAKKRKITPTEHPHIVCVEGLRHGEPVIRGTGVPVWLIAGCHRAGDSVSDIVEMYPHLEAAWVYDAISYYLDHADEINERLEENRRFHENPDPFMAEHHFYPDERGFYRYRPPDKTNSAKASKRPLNQRKTIKRAAESRIKPKSNG